MQLMTARRTAPRVPEFYLLIALVLASSAFSYAPAGAAADARPASKKGLQVQMVDDALALGIKHAALNVSVTSLIDVDGRPDSFKWKSDGRYYALHRGAVEGIPVKPLSDAGVQVNLILLCTTTDDSRLNRIVRPAAAKEAPNGITGFN